MRCATLAAMSILVLRTSAQVAVTITIKVNTPDRPVVIGTTNLPDDTEVMVTVTRAESAYMAQSDARVEKGAFQAGPFSQKGAPLNPGVYKIEISSPLAALQPPSVRAIIGRDGSKLEGPLAKRTHFGGKVIEYRTSFKVDIGKASTTQDDAARAQEQKDRHDWWLQSCKSTCSLTAGYAHSRGESFDWAGCYNKCVSDEPKKKLGISLKPQWHSLHEKLAIVEPAKMSGLVVSK